MLSKKSYQVINEWYIQVIANNQYLSPTILFKGYFLTRIIKSSFKIILWTIFECVQCLKLIGTYQDK